MPWFERLQDFALRKLRAEAEGEFRRTGYVPVPEADDLEFADSERAGSGIREAWEDYIKTAEQTFWGGANGRTNEIDQARIHAGGTGGIIWGAGAADQQKNGPGNSEAGDGR